MLFLMNDQILDLGDPTTTLRETIGQLTSLPLHQLGAKSAVVLGQALFFQCPAGQKPSAGALHALGALFVDKSDVNAVLFVRPRNARTQADVQLRLANVSLPVLANLFQQQKRGPLSTALVNSSVWRSAA